MNYDWDEMADEEIADYLKYRQCAREDKERAIKMIQSGIDAKVWDWVKSGLDILKKGR